MVVALTLRLVATNGSDVVARRVPRRGRSRRGDRDELRVRRQDLVQLPVPGRARREDLHRAGARRRHGGGELTSQCAPCVACKKHCPDIDLEQGYWKEVGERPRRIAYFAWPGIVDRVLRLLLPRGRRAGTTTSAAGGRTSASCRTTCSTRASTSAGAPAHRRGAADADRVRRGELRGVRGARAGDRGRAAPAALVRRHRRRAGGDRDRACGTACSRSRGSSRSTRSTCSPASRRCARCRAGSCTGWGLVVVFASTAIFVRRVTRREDQYVHEKFAQKILKKWEWGDAPPSDEAQGHLPAPHRAHEAARGAAARVQGDGARDGGRRARDARRARDPRQPARAARHLRQGPPEDRRRAVGRGAPAVRSDVPRLASSTRLAREQYRKDLERLVVEAARSGASPVAVHARGAARASAASARTRRRRSSRRSSRPAGRSRRSTRASSPRSRGSPRRPRRPPSRGPGARRRGSGRRCRSRGSRRPSSRRRRPGRRGATRRASGCCGTSRGGARTSTRSRRSACWR